MIENFLITQNLVTRTQRQTDRHAYIHTYRQTDRQLVIHNKRHTALYIIFDIHRLRETGLKLDGKICHVGLVSNRCVCVPLRQNETE